MKCVSRKFVLAAFLIGACAINQLRADFVLIDDFESYTVDSSPDLDDWNELADGVPSDGDATKYTDPNPQGSKVYYRVRLEQ